ncbi:hypothetical protein AKJ38_03050 [candidate division MSBL1 archaeon SCGC-AAA259I14]|uniref:ABC transmembrane type-1 domain-containing protein n=1 Tax=candidate division MSBL1 archaeon SCGC-AAA259I14 TaxID=1698268 RepID=A0A133UQZ8_9EURY|nr:hypothetical protein AKJ38_03050 [candidate division MSBL1 archaeon SCGC-AAA259I14]
MNQLKELDPGRLTAIFGVFIFLLLIWHLIAILYPPRIFPSPFYFLKSFVSILLKSETKLGGSALFHYRKTMERVLIGLGVSFPIGVGTGILMGQSKKFYNLLDNFIWILIIIPAIVWSYIFISVAGARPETAIGVLIALIFPMISMNVCEGVKSLPDGLTRMADSFNVSLWERVRNIYIPFLTPYLLASARVGISVGLKVVIIVEVVGISSGLGFLINYWWGQFYLAPILVWGSLLVITGLSVEYLFFKPLEKKLGGVESETTLR